MRFFNALLWDDTAATAVEYAVLLAMILVTAIAAISSVGQAAGGWWGNIRTEMEAH